MTPQERNQLIDEVIGVLKKSRKFYMNLSICHELGYALRRKNLYQMTRESNFAFISIPILGRKYKHWWPPHDLESRILFLKSVKTCHK